MKNIVATLIILHNIKSLFHVCGLPPRNDASRPFTTVRLCEHAFSYERSVAGSNPRPSKNNDGHPMTVIVCFYSRSFTHPASFIYAFSIRSE